jgi:hypothetical protein
MRSTAVRGVSRASMEAFSSVCNRSNIVRSGLAPTFILPLKAGIINQLWKISA